MDGLLQDLRYAWRTLRKGPAFLTIAVLTLALGIGANLAIFTVVNAVLLQPLPFREPKRIVRVFDDLHGAGAKNVGMSVPELYDLSERSGVFEQISAMFPSSGGLSDRVDWYEPELLRAPRREAGARTDVHAVRVDPRLPGPRRHQRRSLEAPIRLGSAYHRAPRSPGRRWTPVHRHRRHAAEFSPSGQYGRWRHRDVDGIRLHRRRMAIAAKARRACVAWSVGSAEAGNHTRTGTTATRCVHDLVAADVPQ
jgi:hypothetical protein